MIEAVNEFEAGFQLERVDQGEQVREDFKWFNLWKNISNPDMLIATHALVLDVVLVTKNTTGFERIVGLTF